MTQQSKQKKNYKIVFCRGSLLIKLALLGVIVLSTVTLVAISYAIRHGEERYESARDQALELQRENQTTPDDGYVDPDTIILVPKNNGAAPQF